MPPKRKGKSGTAAGKSRKAAKVEDVDDKKKNAPAEEEQEEEATRKESIGEVEKASEEQKKDNIEEVPAAAAAEEKKDGAKPEQEEGGAEEEEKPKPKARGRKKKESAPLVPGTKRVTRSNPGPKEEEKAAKPSCNAHIIIEHCKQCSTFKTRASNIQSMLIEAEPGIKISINPEKPRKGCFEIRDDTGRIFVSLKDLTRPFSELKDLDLEETAQSIIKELT